MKLGSLFSGGGLGDFGFMAAGMEIAWQCEIDEYCQKVLALRYPESKKYRDIKTLKGAELEPVDIIAGGFPCQPFSNAGKRMGKQDDRHLWPEMLRIIQETRPAWVVGENVLGIINLGLDSVLTDLEASGYSAITFVFPAHALGAWHRRERIWIVANAGHNGWSAELEQQQEEWSKESYSGSKGNVADTADAGIKGMRERQEPADKTMGDAGLLGQTKHEKQTAGINQSSENISNTDSQRPQGSRTNGYSERRQRQEHGQIGLRNADAWREYWKTEPSVGRVANGITDRVHRLKMLGNGQVPACTYVIGKMIMDIEANHLKRNV